MAESYEIYIDESGDFEKFSRDQNRAQQKKPIRLIGGVVVPPELVKKEKNLHEELSGIRDKYFPGKKNIMDIHLSDENLTWDEKKQLRMAMLNFFLEKMKGAKIAFIYDLQELDEEPESPGAQIYRNMLMTLLHILMFQHPFFGDNANIFCKLSHRRFPYISKIEDQLANQGYLKLKNAKTGRTEFTAITEEEIKSIMTSTRNTLRFISNRETAFRVRPFLAWNSPFMTMADAVCSTILHILIRADNNQKDFHNELENTFGKERILFYCPLGYDFPANLLSLFHEHKTNEFLSEYLISSEARSAEFRPYDQYLLSQAVMESADNLRSSTTPLDYKNIIALADNFLGNRKFYMLDDVHALIQLVEKQMDKITDGSIDPVWDTIAYKYHDVCVRYYNHTANAFQSRKHRDTGTLIYERFSEREFGQVRAHNEFINRFSVLDTNEFAFERAIVALEPVMKKEEGLLSYIGSGKNEVLGKIYGSVAQNYAFLQDYSNAGKYFKNAKFHLGQHNTMQVSYCAHMALDRKDEITYKEEICSLFKETTFPGYKVLIDLCKRNFDNLSFNLHLLLKGMLIFPPDKNETSKIVQELAYEIHPSKDIFNSHPWELTFIAMGRHLSGLNMIPLAYEFWDASADFTSNTEEVTYIWIGFSARAWKAIFELQRSGLSGAQTILKPITETFSKLKADNSATGIFNPNKIPDEDGKVRAGWFDDIGNRFINEFDGANEATLKSMAEEFINRFTFNYW